MMLENAIKTLDEVIPPHTHRTVDREHLPIALAWEAVKAELQNRAPVVRCGECRFSRGVRPDDGCYPDCIMCENEDMHVTIPVPVYVTDFCSYGERKAKND